MPSRMRTPAWGRASRSAVSCVGVEARGRLIERALLCGSGAHYAGYGATMVRTAHQYGFAGARGHCFPREQPLPPACNSGEGGRPAPDIINRVAKVEGPSLESSRDDLYRRGIGRKDDSPTSKLLGRLNRDLEPAIAQAGYVDQLPIKVRCGADGSVHLKIGVTG